MQDTSLKTVYRRYSQSSSFKMASFFLLLLGPSVILLAYFLYNFSQENVIRETEAAIDQEIENIIFLTKHKSIQQIQDIIHKKAQEQDNPIYFYYNHQEKKLAGNIKHLPDNVQTLSEGVLRFSVIRSNKKRLFAAKLYTFPDNSKLLIGRDIHDIVNNYRKLLLFSGIIIFFILIVVLVSFFISTFVVRRINIIADTAKNIMETGDLSKRINIHSQWDDLSNLAQQLNAMLERIESLMQGIKEVSNNISHDLRTPLTRLRNQLEQAEKTSLSSKAVKQLLKEADDLLHIFNALLRISNIEQGAKGNTFSLIDLTTLINDVIEFYEPLAEEKHIHFDFQSGKKITCMGDRHLLFQAIANLLDNAIKFSPRHSNITIRLHREHEIIQLSIQDSGDGIPLEEREKVFERFYRTDKSRHIPGSGLGLSLVKAVLDLHKARITLQDNHPGVDINIQFKTT